MRSIRSVVLAALLLLAVAGSASFARAQPGGLTVPDNMTVEAHDATGAAVTFTITASNPTTGANLNAACDHPTGATGTGTFQLTDNFALGTTTVSCTTTVSATVVTRSFTVTVVDTTPPHFGNLPAMSPVEATGPNGSTVTYAPPTAFDEVDGPVPVNCAPAPASLFPLGTTFVTCTATDSRGNIGSSSFPVAVVDTTPPHLVVPAETSVDATSAAGVSAGDPAVATFLRSATATDLTDPAPTVWNDAPLLFPIGTTTVTFVATDRTGNWWSEQALLTVRPQKPPEITGLRATIGNRFVRLSWERPKALDFDHLVVLRSTMTRGGPETAVYRGSATTYVDRHLRNGVEYRYVVVSFDQTGNRSAGAVVVATPKRELLTSPRDGARVFTPPRLAWVATHAARYYNLQVFRANEKVLSTWPSKNVLALKRKWTYAGRQYRLTPAVYRWFVWPGFGARAHRRYGPLLGTSSFEIVR